MTPKDFSTLKRRLDPNKRNPTVIIGCYVSDEGEVLASFRKPVAMLPQSEAEHYMSLFRKALSGTQGQNLLPVGFEAAATLHDDAFELMQRLRGSRLQDEDAVAELNGSIMTWLAEEKANAPQSMDAAKHAVSHLILLLEDGFDQYHKGRDGTEDRDRSDTMFTWFLCCVCPVKPRKPDLAFDAGDGDFHMTPDDWTVCPPDVGFLYPAMEQGGADIYSAVYYTRDIADIHEGFVSRVFRAEISMPAAEQKEAIRSILSETLQEECSMEVLQAVHEKVSDMIREQKEDKQADPVSLTGEDLTAVLKDCGVSAGKAEAFAQEMNETFGRNAEVPAVNLVTPKEFRVNTPSVSIRVDPAHSGLVSTRMIDGQRYIMILADGAVEVNGVPVAIAENQG